MKPAGKYCRREGIVGREIAGESFLIPVCGTPVDMENIFALNPVGEFIWRRLDGERTLEKIVGEIAAEFEVSRAQAGADAGDFVAELLRNGLAEELA